MLRTMRSLPAHNETVSLLGFSAIARALVSREPRGERLVIGIDGRTGAGGDVIARQLSFAVGGTVVPVSDFVLPPHRRDDDGGIPVDFDALREFVLEPAEWGDTIRYPMYRPDDASLIEWVDVPSDGPIIVEGAFAFAADLFEQYDATIFVDCDPSECRRRRSAVWGDDAAAAWEMVMGESESNYVQGSAWAHRATFSMDTTEGVR